MEPLLTDELRARLLANGRRVRADPSFNPRPVVKLVLPGSPLVWLLTEIDPERPDHLFGVCDRGGGALEMCYLSEGELVDVRNGEDHGVERDGSFGATMTASAYASDARRHKGGA